MVAAYRILIVCLLPLAARAGTIVNYSISPSILDEGGLAVDSAAYRINPSVGPGAAAASVNYSLRAGFSGQLADVAISYSENTINSAAETLNATVTITDIGSANYNGGTATVSGLIAAQDVVSLPAGAVAVLNSVQLTGANVEIHDGSKWVVVGTASGGQGNNFVVAFNSASTARIAEHVIKNLTFANSSNNPTLTRTLNITLNGNDGSPTQTETIGVNINLDNDVPDITGTVGLVYTEQEVASAFVSSATASDPDQPASFRPDSTHVGSLRVALDGYVTGDLLSVAHIGTGAGQIGVSGTTISYANVNFATSSGGTADDLVITFSSAAATPTAVGALINALRYRSTSDDPTVNNTDPSRVVTVTFNDGANTKDASSSTIAHTDSLTGTINLTAVNDLPVMAVTGAASYSENGLALTVDSTTTVTDSDDTQINGGSVSITTGFLSGDTLAIAGTGNITGAYNALTGVLTLSGTGTLANYQTVLRSLTYVTASEDPTNNATKLTRVLTYSLTDANSDGLGAATGTTTKTINITPINDKPVMTAGATLAYAENDAATAINGTITVNDVDDTQIAGATATISAGLTTGDLLAVTTQNGISGIYTAGTGVLALTGTATLAHYQTALRSVTYRSTSEDPTVTAVNRTVTWAVTDANSDSAGAQTSLAVTSTITITPSNDKPVVTAGATLAYTENAAALAIDGTVTVDDVDDTQITGATATISVGLTTGDLLAVTTLNGISGIYNAGVLTLTGTTTLANYQAAFRRVTYQSTSDDPTVTATSRTVAWAVTDANSDLAGAQTSVAVTSTINITPTNDKAVVTAGATLAYTENAAAMAIDGTVTVNDVDDTQITGATATISAGLTTGDLLAVTTQNGISGIYTAGVLTLTGTTTMANYQTALRSVTYLSSSEDPTVTAVNRTVTWAVTDANSDLAGAQTSVAVTSTITITPSNNKPLVTAGATLAYTENAAATAIDGTITVNDSDDTQIAGATARISVGLTTGDVLAVTTLNGISGTYTAGTGILTLTGTATLANYQAAFRRVTYQSTSDDPTATFASRTLAWVVTDANSDSAGAQSSVAVTSTINLTALKDLPVIVVTGVASYSENGLALTVDSTTTVTDSDDTQINGGSVSITTGFLSGDTLAIADTGNITGAYNALTGVLTLSGTGTLANYQTVLRSLTYVTASENPTDFATKTTRVLTYSLTDANSDGLGAATGTTTKTINITPSNDKPVVTAGATLAYTQNDAATAIDGTITLTDVDDTQIAGATARISAGLTTGDLLAVTTQNGISGSYNSSTGVLTLSGATTTLANYQAALRSVTYRSTILFPTQIATSRTVQWQVTDANSEAVGVQTSVVVTSTINISEVNDAPVNSYPASVSLLENGTLAFNSSNTISVSDTELSMSTTRMTASGGVLTVNLAGGATISAGANISAALTLSGTMAQINAALATLSYTGNRHYKGIDTLTIVSTDAGYTPVMTDTDAVSITVNNINSEPSGADGPILAVMDGSSPLQPSDFGFEDPYDSPANALNRVFITTLPPADKGVIKLSGTSISAGTYVTASDITAGLLVYTPPVGVNGYAYTSFTFQVEDNGGTVDSGVNFDSTPNTLTVHVGGIVPQTLCLCTPREAPMSEKLPLYAYATSKLLVEFVVVSGPATVAGSMMTFTGAGDVVVRAIQRGNFTFLPAPAVEKTIKSVNLSVAEAVQDGWTVSYGGVNSPATPRNTKASALAMKIVGAVAVNVAVAGYETNAAGNRDWYVAKYVASTGAVTWSKTYAGVAASADEATAVAFDSAGNVIVAGHETNALGNTDIVVIKFAEADGQILWKNVFKGINGTTDYGADAIGNYDTVNRQYKGRKNLAIGPSDEVIVGGCVTNGSAGRDLVVVKYASDGTLVWHDIYDPGLGADYANAVAVDSATGNVFVVGASAGNKLDAVTLKYLSNGTRDWIERYDNGNPDEATSLVIDRDGHPVVGGYTQISTYDMFTVRYNKTGNGLGRTTVLDGSTFDNPNYSSSETSWDMALVFGEDVLLAGSSQPLGGVSNAYTMRFRCSCSGGARWDKEYGDPSGKLDQMVAVGTDYFGNTVATGYSQNSSGKYEVYTAKYRAEDGSFLWSKKIAGSGNSEPTALGVDPSGNVFVAGYTTLAGGTTDLLVQSYKPYDNVSRAAQTITFTNPGPQFAGTKLVLAATSSSGLRVDYVVVSGPATLSGSQLSLNGSGAVTIRATQTGSSEFMGALSVDQTFAVSKSSQTISFSLPEKIYKLNGSWETWNLSGTSSSGLEIIYSVTSGPATISGGVLTLSGAGGPVTVRASQVGDSSFRPAPNVDRTVIGEDDGTLLILSGGMAINWKDVAADDPAVPTPIKITGEGNAIVIEEVAGLGVSGCVTGFTNGVNGTDLVLVKYEQIGGVVSQLWTTAVNGPANGNDAGTALTLAGDGSVIVAGYITTVAGRRDVYVAKFSTLGVKAWEYTYDGTAHGDDAAVSVGIDRTTTHVVVGGYAVGSSTGRDFFAAKLDFGTGLPVSLGGGLKWEKTINRATTQPDMPSKMSVGTDGSVVLAGGSGPNLASYSSQSDNAWTVKLAAADGALVWQKVYSIRASNPDSIIGLGLDSANNVIVTGYSRNVNYDIYTAKYNADTGALIWEARYNGGSSDNAYDMFIDRKGDVYVVGATFRSAGVKDGITIKYSGLNGSLAWNYKPFAGTVSANNENISIGLDGLGDVVTVGYSTITAGKNIYLSKLRGSGTLLNEQSFSGIYTRDDLIRGVKVDKKGNIWMTGYTTNTSGQREVLVLRMIPAP